jgi:hypothetical protein
LPAQRPAAGYQQGPEVEMSVEAHPATFALEVTPPK